jgi:hypothetical protein
MLIEWKPQVTDRGLAQILNLLAENTVLPGLVEGQGPASEHVEMHKGIYMIGHFNGSHVFPKDVFDEYPSGLTCGSYGVCDSVENLLEYAPDLITSEREFVVTMTRVSREDQPEYGGWRWHKWGEYIGKFDSQCEYLYDEEGIDEVFCYHVFEKVNVIPRGDLKHGTYYGTSGLGYFDGVRWNANTQKFMAYIYDYEESDHKLTSLDYSPNWHRNSNKETFSPVRVYDEEIRRPVRFDDEPPLIAQEQ